MPQYRKSEDGLLEIEQDSPVKEQISLEHIEQIITSTKEEKEKSLIRIASLDASIAYYEGLKAQAIALGITPKEKI